MRVRTLFLSLVALTLALPAAFSETTQDRGSSDKERADRPSLDKKRADRRPLHKKRADVASMGNNGLGQSEEEKSIDPETGQLSDRQALIDLLNQDSSSHNAPDNGAKDNDRER